MILSSYYNARRGNHWLSKGKIWEAARATSAATTFFDPITIDGETFVDGATGANNPVNELWSEAGDIWGDGGGLDPSKVQSLVSIGTGTPASVAFGPDVAGLSRALKAISTETEMTASTFQKHHSKLFQAGRAFRFSVVAGLEHVGLHEVEKWDEIKASTNAYMQAEDTFIKLRQCALMLKERQCRLSLLIFLILHHGYTRNKGQDNLRKIAFDSLSHQFNTSTTRRITLREMNFDGSLTRRCISAGLQIGRGHPYCGAALGTTTDLRPGTQ